MKRSKKKKSTVLACDPSFTAWGWAVLSFKGKVKEVGCIKTAPENKVRKIRKGDDTIRRISIIANTLLSLIEKHNVGLILIEQPHGSQNASGAVMMGMVAGLVQGIGESLNLPVEWYTEGDAKRNLFAGKKQVTKREVVEKIATLYDVEWTNTKYKDEAIADAIAIFDVGIKTSNLLKMHRNG